MFTILSDKPVVKLLASEKTWIEGEAVRQFKRTSELDGMRVVVGMPDLHPGRGNPVGAAFAVRDWIYPYIIGNDGGCGIGLWKTSLKANKVKRDKWAKKLVGLQSPWEGDMDGFLSEHGLVSSDFDTALGTIGMGNHFAELLKIDKVVCGESFEEMGLDKKSLFLMVHSGSRGMGNVLLRSHTEVRGDDGLPAESSEAKDYMKAHEYTLTWAGANRSLIARRFVTMVGGTCAPVLDVCHNSITPISMDGERLWLHRKGVAASDGGPVLIPGSRGALTYLVKPLGNQEENLWSVAHGAGRRWDRGSCRKRIKSKFSAKSLTHTNLGSLVICKNRDLLYEEAPQGYKNIEGVIKDMTDAGVVKVIAAFRPLITYKVGTRRGT